MRPAVTGALGHLGAELGSVALALGVPALAFGVPVLVLGSISAISQVRRLVAVPASVSRIADADRVVASRLLLGAILGAGLGMRLWLAFHDDGIYWPDEIYQSLEPAHRIVFGTGMLPWEFVAGSGNWTLPGAIAILFKVAALLRLPRPAGYLALTRTALCLAGGAAVYFSYRLARRLGASRSAAIAGAALLGLGAVPVYFAPRALSETASILPVVAGFALALPAGDRWRRLLGTALLALSVFLNPADAVLCAALLIAFLVGHRYRDCLEAALLLAAAGLVYGAVDRLTWADWFHSPRLYLLWNLDGGATRLGVSPVTYYLSTVWHLPWLWGATLVGLALLGSRRSPALAFAVGAFLLVQSVTPHKEFPFILSSFPLLAALSALGLDILRPAMPFVFRAATLAVLVVALLSGATFERLTPLELGGSTGSRAYDASGSLNRLLLAAHDRPDLCGIDIEGKPLAWSGGYTYLDRAVPLYGGQATGPGYYNYLVAEDSYLAANPPPPGSQLVKRDHDWSLFRSSPSCELAAPPTARL
jgi:phosphatidylinositol glycan class B